MTLVLRPVQVARWIRQPIERHTLLYLLASMLDVVFTYLLLYGEGPMVFTESNPVARYFLQESGFLGMVVFKIALVLMVAINCQVIARKRPTTALRLMQFAGVTVAGVVAWSGFLLWQYN